jgi:hypothetical protein
MIGEEIKKNQYLLHFHFNGNLTNNGSLSVSTSLSGSGGIESTGGKFNGYANYPYAAGRINIAENSGLNLTNNLFAKFWVKVTDSSRHVVLSNIYWQTGVSISGFILYSTGLGVCPLNSGAGPQGAYALTNIFDGKWHLIYATYNTTNGGKVWVDGKLDNVNTSYKPTPGYKSGQKQAFAAFYDYTGSTWNYAAVQIDDFCFGQLPEPSDSEVRKWYAWCTGKLL